MAEAKTFWNSFSSLIYPSRCALCSALGDLTICESCLQDFIPSDHLRSSSDGPLRLAATLYPYHGRIGQAVRRLKYSRATGLAAPLAEMMAQGVARLGLGHYDFAVPIPIHWSRRCLRGFNQSELLCENLSNVTSGALRRIRRTKPQVRLSREERIHNMAGAFRATPVVAGKSILLIDDVLTSGQTARECAKALAACGARDVAALALAGEAF